MNDAKAIVLIVGALVALIAGIGIAVNHLQAVGELAEIEQLRADIGRVGCVASEDVLGQATQWNQKIASRQRYNARWWADLFVPDSWDAVEKIPAARCP